MPDYNLTSLSARSFEQLIQAISIKVIGPNVVIFGDGRDGGREATFEGRISYPSTELSWDGYGVIQAKFKQRVQDTDRDGAWALTQLRNELEDFVNPKKSRRIPEYYIFATNVVLTPVPDVGSKDKVAALFKEFSDRVPLKAYDVWDYDKIRAFLDDNEELRHSYAAWITPGDVLAQVIEWLKPASPNFEPTITSFLQKELLADQYANLEQAGHAPKDRIPISQVFVDLPSFDKHLVEAPDETDDNGRLPSGIISKIVSIAAERLDPLLLCTSLRISESCKPSR